jgi:hypothetical protein
MDRWTDATVWNPRLGAEDRRDLVRYLRTDEFLDVVMAESQVETLDGTRAAIDALKRLALDRRTESRAQVGSNRVADTGCVASPLTWA